MREGNGGMLAPLRREHKELILRLGLVTKGIESPPPSSSEALGRLLADFGTRLEAHFKREEESLYGPLVSALGRESPVSPMMDGQRVMRRALRQVLSALSDYGAVPSPGRRVELGQRIDSLQRMVEEYVRKEEKVVFWIAELTLDPGSLLLSARPSKERHRKNARDRLEQRAAP